MAISDFERAVAEIRAIKPRPEINIEEVPAPQKLAPHAVAFNVEVLSGDSASATGRFVLLHDPVGQDGWSGEFRCVTYARAAIDAEMANDPLMCDVGWAWLMDSLRKHGCDYVAPSGTVTRVASVAFGMLADREDDSEVEVRASWTPVQGKNVANHMRAWLELLELACSLEPIPEGVTAISPRR